MSELSHAKRLVAGLQAIVDQTANHFSAEFSADGTLSTDDMDRDQIYSVGEILCVVAEE